jgi:hypothetical protein
MIQSRIVLTAYSFLKLHQIQSAGSGTRTVIHQMWILFLRYKNIIRLNLIELTKTLYLYDFLLILLISI